MMSGIASDAMQPFFRAYDAGRDSEGNGLRAALVKSRREKAASHERKCLRQWFQRCAGSSETDLSMLRIARRAGRGQWQRTAGARRGGGGPPALGRPADAIHTTAAP